MLAAAAKKPGKVVCDGLSERTKGVVIRIDKRLVLLDKAKILQSKMGNAALKASNKSLANTEFYMHYEFEQ